MFKLIVSSVNGGCPLERASEHIMSGLLLSNKLRMGDVVRQSGSLRVRQSVRLRVRQSAHPSVFVSASLRVCQSGCARVRQSMFVVTQPFCPNRL